MFFGLKHKPPLPLPLLHFLHFNKDVQFAGADTRGGVNIVSEMLHDGEEMGSKALAGGRGRGARSAWCRW